MPNIEYRGHVTLPVEPCNRYDGFGTIDGVDVCRCGQPYSKHPRLIHAPRVQCAECGRVFNLMSDDDAAEWSTGHDCEN